MRGKTPEKRFAPAARVSVNTTVFIPCSGLSHGPPELVHPAQFGNVTSMPRRFASLWRWSMMSYHSGEANTTGPAGMKHPTSRTSTPPMPTFAIASKSSVMHSFDMLPFMIM